MGYLMKTEDRFSPPLETSLIWTYWESGTVSSCPWVKVFSISILPPFRHGLFHSYRKKTCQHKTVLNNFIEYQWGCKSSLSTAFMADEHEDVRWIQEGNAGKQVLAAPTGQETSYCPPVPTSVVATSLLLSSLWVLFCAGHSKCTQWNTWKEQKMKIKQNNLMLVKTWSK